MSGETRSWSLTAPMLALSGGDGVLVDSVADVAAQPASETTDTDNNAVADNVTARIRLICGFMVCLSRCGFVRQVFANSQAIEQVVAMSLP
jgi:hypothetical protein